MSLSILTRDGYRIAVVTDAADGIGIDQPHGPGSAVIDHPEHGPVAAVAFDQLYVTVNHAVRYTCDGVISTLDFGPVVHVDQSS